MRIVQRICEETEQIGIVTMLCLLAAIANFGASLSQLLKANLELCLKGSSSLFEPNPNSLPDTAADTVLNT